MDKHPTLEEQVAAQVARAVNMALTSANAPGRVEPSGYACTYYAREILSLPALKPAEDVAGLVGRLQRKITLLPQSKRALALVDSEKGSLTFADLQNERQEAATALTALAAERDGYAKIVNAYIEQVEELELELRQAFAARQSAEAALAVAREGLEDARARFGHIIEYWNGGDESMKDALEHIIDEADEEVAAITKLLKDE